MVKVISFCVYGTEDKYCLGLLKNIKLVQEHLPDYQVWIYGGSDVPEHYVAQYTDFDHVQYIETERTGGQLTCYRFFAIDEEDVEICHYRDADSRVTERDRYLIRAFEKSNKSSHIIREHYWHKDKITAGIWGLKKGALTEKIQDMYQKWIQAHEDIRHRFTTDQVFLAECVYPQVSSSVLIHSNIVGFKGENITPIDLPRKDDADFLGNVLLFDENGEEYPEFLYSSYPLHQHLIWLLQQEQWTLIVSLTKELCEDQETLFKYTPSDLHSILNSVYVAYYYLGELEKCKDTFSKFRWTHVNDPILVNSCPLLNRERTMFRKRIIGTTDPSREPGPGEIILCYGNYAHGVENLPHSESPNKLYRHAFYKDLMQHNVFEYHPCWEKIDQIYVLNLKTRKDRWMEILVELCRMGAPLHRIYHYEAPTEVVTGEKQVDKYLGATKNHLDVVDHFLENNYEHCLILEDDFTFTSNIAAHQRDLMEFFRRGYDFDVCLIAASKYHKIRPHDDLLLKSYQECTTTSGYLLKRDTAPRVHACFKEGYEQIKATHQYHTYVCDRYWAKLQKDEKFFLFKRKFGYQRPNYSSITEQIDCHFD